MRKLAPFFVCVMLAAPAVAAAVALDVDQGRHGAAAAEEYTDNRIAQRGCKSLADAVAQVRRQHDVQRIISAKTDRRGNREVHRIKFMTRDGTVKTESIQGCRLD